MEKETLTPGPLQIFKSPYGYGIAKDNSATRIDYRKSPEEALLCFAERFGIHETIRAVNAHDALVAIAKRAAQELRELDPRKLSASEIEFARMIEDALAKLEKGAI